MTRLRLTNLANALFYLPRPALVLVPILLKGLTVIVTLGVTAWLRSTWMDLCFLAAVVGYTLLRWSCLRYALDGEVLRIREGLLVRKTTAIPADRIAVVASVRHLLLRPFGVCLIEADTSAGSRGRADFRLYLSAADTRALFHTHSDGDIDLPEQQQYRPRNASVLLLSLFTSNSLMGLILLAAVLQNLGKIVGEDLSHRLMTRLGALGELLAFGVPPAAAMVALIAALGWSVAFLREFLRNKNFLTVRTGRVLSVYRGLFNLRSTLVQADRIRFVQIRETAASRLLGLGAVYLHAVGVSRKQEDLLPVIPVVRTEHLPDLLRGLLPEFEPGPLTVRPADRSFLRFTGPALAAMAGAVGGGWLLGQLWSEWQPLTGWLTLAGLLPAVWFFVVRVIDWQSSGIGYTNGDFTLRYSKRFYLHTVVIPGRNVVGVTFRQSIFQVFRGNCDLILDTHSQSRRRHRVRNLPLDEARQLFAGTGIFS